MNIIIDTFDSTIFLKSGLKPEMWSIFLLCFIVKTCLWIVNPVILWINMFFIYAVL